MWKMLYKEMILCLVWCFPPFVIWMQNHMRVLETAPENRTALLMGLEYLIGISYVEDTEIFKVGLLNYIC
jgi:hypothetical protein